MAITLKNILALIIIEDNWMTFPVLHRIPLIYQVNVIIQERS